MGRYIQRRQQTDLFFNKMDARANYIGLLFGQSKDDAMDKHEQIKESFKEKVDESIEKIDELDGLSEEEKLSIKGKFEHLKLQLSLGKAETIDAFERDRKEIRNAINALDMEIQTDMDVFDDTLGKAWDEMDAELEDLVLVFNEGFNEMKADFKDSKEKLLADIDNFKTKIKSRRKLAGQKVSEMIEEFDKEFENMHGYFVYKI